MLFARSVKVIDVNNAALKLHEYEEKAELLSSWISTLMPTAIAAFADVLLVIWRNERQCVLDAEVQTKSGEVRNVRVHWSVPPGYEETLSRVLVSLVDVTESKQSEEALKRSEEKYRRLFEEDLAANFVSKADGTLLACNPAFVNLFGFESKEDAMSHKAASFYPSPEARREFLELLTEQKQVAYYELDLRRKDGEIVHVIENAAGTFDENGRLVEVRGYLMDDTARRKIEEQFRQAQKLEAVGRLAGGIAHDFNNLLTAILGYGELLASQMAPSSPQLNSVSEIVRAGERAAALTRQLLAFSRKQVLQPKIVDLNDIVSGMDKMLRPLIGEDIELIAHLDPAIGRVKADQGQIEQVILNLAVNARDAMPSGGKLTIETANADLDEDYARSHIGVSPGLHVVLAIADTGCGIPAEIQPHIFEPFFTTKEIFGTGLGLSTVYGIVKQSGGNIWVYSEVGVGTTFKIYLPRVDAEAEDPITRPGNKSLSRGTETILLVEDSDLVRRLTAKILRSAGYTVWEAENGDEAQRLVTKSGGRKPHLLLTDIVMPHMSGKELAELIQRSLPEIKVLFMSGYTDNAVVRQDLIEGAASFLQKPFTGVTLTSKVREVLDAS